MVYTLQPEFGYVLLIASSTALMNVWHMLRIGKLRKKYGIKYPQMTSSKHMDFTCAQRVHQNTLENIPFFLFTLLAGGMRHPWWAAVFGAGWVLSRIIYSLGYYSGVPERREPGAIGGFATLFLLTGLSVSTGAGIAGLW